MKYTVFERMTLQVFGRGLTREEALQCARDNATVRNHETEAEFCRNDSVSDLIIFKVRALAAIGDDHFEAEAKKQRLLLGIKPKPKRRFE